MTPIEEDNAVRWSRCSAGKNRWFWAVYPSIAECKAKGGEWHCPEPAASGFERTLEAAESTARKLAGDSAVIYHDSPARLARATRWEQACEKRRNAAINGKGQTGKLELVWEAYTHISMDGEFEPYWRVTPYRVVKKTARKVYVDREHFREEDWREQVESPEELNCWRFDLHTFILDRQELESGEGATSARRSYHDGRFYLTREAAEKAGEHLDDDD
jgi:hypothetical protein